MLIDEILSLIAPDSCICCQKDGSLLCYYCFNNFKKSESQKIKNECLFCKTGNENTSGICSICNNKLKLKAVYFVGYHEGVLKNLIWRLKFHSSLSVLKPLIPELADKLQPLANKDCYLITLPTAPARIRSRGFDQAKKMSSSLAKPNPLWSYSNILIRVNDVDQIGRSKTERKDAAKQMFALNPKKVAKLNKKYQLILVDDVMTTGATISAAASLLYDAGFKNISAALLSYKKLE